MAAEGISAEVSHPSALEIPPENREGSQLPDASGSFELVKRLLNAISTQSTANLEPLFFPRAAFIQLKDIPRNEQYYDKLLQWFSDDIRKEYQKLKPGTSLVFEKFILGRCRWKAVGTEYNKIPYWSCSRSQILATADGKQVKIQVVAMINWGKLWYPTHLGPIPK